MRTPADLRSLRVRCGLSMQEGADLCALPVAFYERLERARQHHVYPEVGAAMAAIEAAILRLRDDVAAWWPGGPLIGFTRFEDLAEFEPDHAASLRVNAAHRMLLALLSEETGEPVVEIVPDDYARFLADAGEADSRGARRKWAENRLGVFKVHPGRPKVKGGDDGR